MDAQIGASRPCPPHGVHQLSHAGRRDTAEVADVDEYGTCTGRTGTGDVVTQT
ncbi:hypothetical protein [Gordonia sputi]|uniref:hypothetical protein n=1 Tax=Gordonia sputi TaxID=36823 RepID=UPI001443B446|nr:hypothetical protein [Gordonia sputi]NKY95500.1 hypothetical protein [Gordonia sputi]